MTWLLLILAVAALLGLASLGRKAKQKEAVAKLRREFPRIARLRLVAACPGLDGVLGDAELRVRKIEEEFAAKNAVQEAPAEYFTDELPPLEDDLPF